MPYMSHCLPKVGKLGSLLAQFRIPRSGCGGGGRRRVDGQLPILFKLQSVDTELVMARLRGC
jgi:hypothetical protein